MSTPDLDTVRSALELAVRAPSVHNTQPWAWRYTEHSLHLFADRDRALDATDPQGRDLVVSCGAVLHHARVAFAAMGWATTVHRLPNPALPDHLAALEFTALDPTTGEVKGAIKPETQFLIIGRKTGDNRTDDKMQEMVNTATANGMFIISAENFATVIGYRPNRGAASAAIGEFRPGVPVAGKLPTE